MDATFLILYTHLIMFLMADDISVSFAFFVMCSLLPRLQAAEDYIEFQDLRFRSLLHDAQVEITVILFILTGITLVFTCAMTRWC